MPFTLPATLKYDGARDRDSVNYQATGHTPAVPKIVIFDRKVPSTSAPKEQYRVRVIHGAVKSDGTPLVPGIMVDLTISSHMLASNADVEAALAQLKEIVNADGFAEMAIVSQLLPR